MKCFGLQLFLPPPFFISFIQSLFYVSFSLVFPLLSLSFFKSLTLLSFPSSPSLPCQISVSPPTLLLSFSLNVFTVFLWLLHTRLPPPLPIHTLSALIPSTPPTLFSFSCCLVSFSICLSLLSHLTSGSSCVSDQVF